MCHLKTTISRTCKVDRDARLIQCQGIFDLPPDTVQRLNWPLDITIPDDWSIGAIVGESGSGKTTIARKLAELLGGRLIESRDAAGNLIEPFSWNREKAVCSALPHVPINEWTGLLSRVGFSSPPAWCRPYHVLSQGQQFRCNLARSIAEGHQDKKETKNSTKSEVKSIESSSCPPSSPSSLRVSAPIFFDEFASLVHDQVARIASAAVSKAVRALNKQFVAVTWRTDILDSLEPDWVIFVNSDQTVRLQLNEVKAHGQPTVGKRWSRPKIDLRVIRTDRTTWPLFAPHHYLSGNLHKSAQCFVGLVNDRPACFTAVLSFPHPHKPAWREHRTVCHPEMQGVGIGNRMSETVAAMFAATGKPYQSTTSHPAMIQHRRRSSLWKMNRAPSMVRRPPRHHDVQMSAKTSVDRLTAGFEFIGPPDFAGAKGFGLI
jgi:hypothetical protein